eukprot:TRINITY_DN14600_c0_g1_i2.p1 TRINITY_DN14600_c0_g1~~TRINITY_DN14600_c0_g1_i2.p1  ORF type:complete len:213 (-),score=40.17 TRINITY_DN14600_c0_g1_i2:35-592(-)
MGIKDIKTTDDTSRIFYFLLLVKRIVHALTLVFLQTQWLIQFGIFILVDLLFLTIIIAKQPFITGLANIKEGLVIILNLFSLLILILMGFEEDIHNREKYGLVFIALVSFQIVLQVLMNLATSVIAFIQRSKLAKSNKKVSTVDISNHIAKKHSKSNASRMSKLRVIRPSNTRPIPKKRIENSDF